MGGVELYMCCITARIEVSGMQDRIFNRLYDSKVSAFERVKYGVLNIGKSI